jgi:homoserine dehydrogenase
MGMKIKLIGQSQICDGQVYAMVSPMLIEDHYPLAAVRDVFNAIVVRGNMVDDVMFYGKGAGSLPTASAVAADVVDCVKNAGKNVKINWCPEKLVLGDIGSFERRFFVRAAADESEDKIKELFGYVSWVSLKGINEKAFITESMKEKDFDQAAGQIQMINRIRLH